MHVFRIIKYWGNKKCILCIAFAFLSISCISQEIAKIRIDPALAFGGDFSDVFEDVEYIPLETTKESIFGNTTTFIIAEGNYVIWDEDTRYILFFGSKGKFLKKIKVDQYIYPSIYYDAQSKFVTVLLSNSQTQRVQNLHFDKNGNRDLKWLRASTPYSEFNFLLPLTENYFVKPNSCYLAPSQRANDSTINLIEIYKGNNLHKSFLPTNQKDNLALCTLGLGQAPLGNISKDGVFYTATPFDHLIYKIDKDTAIKAYQLVFPTNTSLSRKILNSRNRKFIDSVNNTKWYDDNTIRMVKNIFVVNNYLLFKLDRVIYFAGESSESNRQNDFIYNLTSGKLISFEHITSDKRSFYLPFFDKTEHFSIRGFLYDGSYFYTAISSLNMFTAKNNNNYKHPQYPEALQRYFVSQNRKSNPVMVRMKLKSSID